MSTAICVLGCTLKATASDAVHFVVSQVAITNQPGDKVFAENKKAYIDKISFSVSWTPTLTPAEQATLIVTPGTASGETGDITGTSSKATSISKSFVLKTDSETIDVSFDTTNVTTTPQSPGPHYAGTIKVEVNDPGQSATEVT